MNRMPFVNSKSLWNYGPDMRKDTIGLDGMNMVLGRLDESTEPAEKAVALDPHSPCTRVYLGQFYLANAQPENA